MIPRVRAIRQEAVEVGLRAALGLLRRPDTGSDLVPGVVPCQARPIGGETLCW
jgi:hypothetical protein